MKLSVDGAICHALVDSGCSHCIVHAPYCASWTRKRADVMTMSGERQRCEGVGRVQLRVSNGDSVVVDVYVVDFKPLDFEFILGVNGISALGGVTISPSLAMHFGSADEKPTCAVAMQVEKIVGAGVTQAEKIVGAGVTQAEKIVGAGVTQAEKTVGAGAIEIDAADEKPICAVATQVEKIVGAGVTQAEKIVGAGVTQAEKTVGAGAIEIDEIWHRVGMDVTHVNGGHYLTLIDCGPTRFAVWRRMQRQDTASVIQQLESVFFERGAPVELLTDNDPAFRSGAFTQFAERWALRVRFRCAYVASGSGITERCHRFGEAHRSEEALYHCGSSLLVQCGAER